MPTSTEDMRICIPASLGPVVGSGTDPVAGLFLTGDFVGVGEAIEGVFEGVAFGVIEGEMEGLGLFAIFVGDGFGSLLF